MPDLLQGGSPSQPPVPLPEGLLVLARRSLPDPRAEGSPFVTTAVRELLTIDREGDGWCWTVDRVRSVGTFDTFGEAWDDAARWLREVDPPANTVGATVTCRFTVQVPVTDAEANSLATGDAPEVENRVFRKASNLVAAQDDAVEEDISAIRNSAGQQI